MPLPAGATLTPTQAAILAQLSPIAPTLPAQFTKFDPKTVASALNVLTHYGLAIQTSVQQPLTGIQQTAFLAAP
jgi:hypothetical protein